MKGQSRRRQLQRHFDEQTSRAARTNKFVTWLLDHFGGTKQPGHGPERTNSRDLVPSVRARRSPETSFRLQDEAEKKRQRRRDRNRAWLTEYRATYYAFNKLGYDDASTYQGAA